MNFIRHRGSRSAARPAGTSWTSFSYASKRQIVVADLSRRASDTNILRVQVCAVIASFPELQNVGRSLRVL